MLARPLIFVLLELTKSMLQPAELLLELVKFIVNVTCCPGLRVVVPVTERLVAEGVPLWHPPPPHPEVVLPKIPPLFADMFCDEIRTITATKANRKTLDIEYCLNRDTYCFVRTDAIIL